MAGVIAGMPLRSKNFSEGLYFMILSIEYSVRRAQFVNSRCSRTFEVCESFNKGWSVILTNPLNFKILKRGKPITSMILNSSFLTSPLGKRLIPSSPTLEQPVRSSSSS
jgi:hypothetical protein